MRAFRHPGKPKRIRMNGLVHRGLVALIALVGLCTAVAAETEYLSFQVFEGSADPAIPFDATVIYPHVAFLTKARYDEFVAAGMIDPAVASNETMVNLQSSTQQPSVALVANSRPGFTTYPGVGQFDQIQQERALHAMPAWASSAGANSLGGLPDDSGITMETYLAGSFNHGTTLVDVYGWGLGGTIVTNNPYRVATEAPGALTAYRKFLTGQTLVASDADGDPLTSRSSPLPPTAR